MQTIISREYWFSAAHQLEGHPKCGRLHGHNYKVTVVMSTRDLNNGMVIDFGELDQIVKPIVDELDHRYIVSADNFDKKNPYVTFARSLGHSQNEAKWYIPFSTAECLAQAIHIRIGIAIKDSFLMLRSVSVQETEKSVATYQ